MLKRPMIAWAKDDGAGAGAGVTDPPAVDPPGGAGGDAGGEPPGGGGGDDARIGELVEQKVRELLGDGSDDGNRGEHTGGEVTAPASSGSSSSSNESMESVAARTVRAELDKLHGEQAREEKIGELEGKVKELERPPVKQNRWSRFLWGDANK